LRVIEQSPFNIADYFLENASEWPNRGERARTVIGRPHGEDARTEWSQIVASNIRVRTTLCSLGQETSARLLHHAYVTAMANLHVILGCPLLDMLPPERLEDHVK
jgi:lipase chaperone LimK